MKENGIYCRFCEKPFENADKLTPEIRVCSNPECRKNLVEACLHICECGHPCCGTRGEREHIGCGECGFDVCSVCGDPLNIAPTIKLSCSHFCHKRCAQEIISTCPREGLINFPICKQPGCGCVIESPLIDSKFFVDLHKKVESMMPKLIEEENIRGNEHVLNENDPDYYGKPEKFAWDNFLFFICQKCGDPYFGGLKNCGEEIDKDAEFICEKCSRVGFASCPIHNNDFMVYKCFFCCKPATFHCWGTTHFCNECHKHPDKVLKGPNVQCDGNCQFAPHPPNGTRKYFGYCRLCESQKKRYKY